MIAKSTFSGGMFISYVLTIDSHSEFLNLRDNKSINLGSRQQIGGISYYL